MVPLLFSHANATIKCNSTVLRFRQFSVKDLVDERVHGLGDAHHSREHDAPCIGVVESTGGGDDDGVEPDGCGKVHIPDVSAGDVFLEHPNERGHDQRHEPEPERGHGADIRIILLRR